MEGSQYYDVKALGLARLQAKDAALCDHVAPAADGQQESLLARAVTYYNGRAFNTQIDEFIRCAACLLSPLKDQLWPS